MVWSDWAEPARLKRHECIDDLTYDECRELDGIQTGDPGYKAPPEGCTSEDGCRGVLKEAVIT